MATHKSLVLVGMMGTGKSTIGKEVAKKLKIDFIDTDQLIEKEANLTIAEIFKKNGEKYFRELEEKGVGWDLDLNSLPSFANAILHLEKQSLGTHQAMRAQTRDYGLTLQSHNASLPAMRALLKDL